MLIFICRERAMKMPREEYYKFVLLTFSFQREANRYCYFSIGRYAQRHAAKPMSRSENICAVVPRARRQPPPSIMPPLLPIVVTPSIAFFAIIFLPCRADMPGAASHSFSLSEELFSRIDCRQAGRERQSERCHILFDDAAARRHTRDAL